MRMRSVWNNRQGSVTILAVGVMLFLGIIISGVLPMITQEVRSGTLNRDAVEAQYAAEAGLKRALTGLVVADKDWDWVINAQTISFIGQNGSSYKVSLQLDSPTTLTQGHSPDSGWYYLQSEGTVNNAIKRVKVKANLTAGSGGTTGVFANGVFGTAAIESNNSTINGSAGTNSYFKGWKTTINGDLLAVEANNSSNQWQKNIVTGTTTDNTSTPPAQALTVPKFYTNFSMPAAPDMSGAAAWPVSPKLWNESGVVFPSGKYQLTGRWSVGKSTVSIQPNATFYATGEMEFSNHSKITMAANDTLYSGDNLTIESTGLNITTQANTFYYVVKDFSLGNSATLTMADNAIICVQGNMKLDNGSVLRTQGKAKIYVQGDLELANGGTGIYFEGDTEVYVGGSLKLSNPSQINTVANTNVVFKCNKIEMANSSSISGATGGSLILLAETTVNMSNTTSINNALVMAKGDITIQGGSVTGSVISTGAVVRLDGATVTYDPTLLQLALTNNSSLFTGITTKSSIKTIEWMNY